jgi:hypothetical protein
LVCTCGGRCKVQRAPIFHVSRCTDRQPRRMPRRPRRRRPQVCSRPRSEATSTRTCETALNRIARPAVDTTCTPTCTPTQSVRRMRDNQPKSEQPSKCNRRFNQVGGGGVAWYSTPRVYQDR